MNKEVISICTKLKKLTISSPNPNPLSTMDEYNKERLKIFPPVLRKNFDFLLKQQGPGICPSQVSDITPSKWCKFENINFNYGYNIKIPYAGSDLTWEVLFMPNRLRCAPDFNFNDASFAMAEDVDLVENHVPGLATWNVDNSQSLSTILQEFLTLYKKQQITKLSNENIYADLYADYSHLTETVSNTKNVEVLVENGNVHFIINLPIDISALAEYVQGDDEEGNLLNPGKDFVLLKVSYLKMKSCKTAILLSPRLEQCLGNMKNFNLPNFTKETKLGTFVLKISSMLKDQIKKKIQHHTLKKEYLTYAATTFRGSIVEFDSKFFTKFAVLTQVDGYQCILHVQLGPNFPDEQPTVSLQSIYCFTYTRPCLDEVEDYPYSPRWKPKDMINKMMVYLVDAISRFQRHNH